MKAALALTLLSAAGIVAAQDMVVSGTNTVRIERYDTDGDALASPFPHTGTTGYDELALDFAWQPSSFDRWRGLFAGVANDSPYRSPHRGFVPERLALARENGEAAVPYRAEAGDFFAFTSLRTQQRPLKGLSLELQPILASPDLQTSVLLFGGVFHPTWRDLRWRDDNTVGLSWLTQWRGARLTVNALHNERAADATLGRASVEQDLASVAAEAPFALGASRWRAEGEAAFLRGDPDFAFLPPGAEAGDREDEGYFAQLSGSLAAEPLSWRLRGERYGRNYRPIGAAIAPDRRALEAHVSWQSPQALALNARLQDFRDAFESANPLDTRVVGLAAFGPIAPLGATFSVDLFRQRTDRADGSLSQRNITMNASASRPFGPVIAQLGALYQRVEDRVLADASPRTRQVTLQATAPLRLGELTGSISPGLTWREIDGSPLATRDWQANLQLALFGGPHRLSLNAGRLAQDPSLPVNPEVATVNFGLDYRYRWGRHEFGADVVVFDRKPVPGEKTEAWKAGLSWSYSFDAMPLAPLAVARGAPPSEVPISRDAGLLAGIAPGDPLDATLARLSASGFGGGMRLPGMVVYEARLLPEVDERQRLAIVHANGRVERVALVVSLPPSAGPQDAERAFDRARRALIDRYGRPSGTHESGTFAPGYANELAAGRLLRIAEWRTDRGMLRAGIPRRLDGLARIEIHHAASFPGARETGWGLESLR